MLRWVRNLSYLGHFRLLRKVGVALPTCDPETWLPCIRGPILAFYNLTGLYKVIFFFLAVTHHIVSWY